MRIALVSEGTYPYAMGGVSVWCDQIIKGMPEHDWVVVPLVVDGRERPTWELPAQVSALVPIALWTPAPPGRNTPTPGELAAYRDLVDLLVRPLRVLDEAPEQGRIFLARLQTFWQACRDAGTGPTGPAWLTSGASLDALSQAWTTAHGTAISLRDNISWSRMFMHLLRPLFAPMPEVDVVHATMNGPSVLVAFAAQWGQSTPFVLSEHGIYLRERYLLTEAGPLPPAQRVLRLTFFRLLASAAYAAASAIAPHSKYNTRWQVRGGADPQRITVMYNGVVVDNFDEAIGEPDLPTISYLGRLDPIKDIKTLVQAFALVAQEVPNARLRIFGDAPAGQEAYLAECRELVRSLDLEQAVRFEGGVKNPMLAYHAGTIVALTSISEGFPYTVIEAMACGRPVVVTDVGGVPEAVGEGGLVVPPKDPPAFAAACVTLLTDQERRRHCSTAARARVVEWFTLDRWVRAYGLLYLDVAQRCGTATDQPELPDRVVTISGEQRPELAGTPNATDLAAAGGTR